MQQDELVWQCINQGFCSYKIKTKTHTFCRNKYNINGLCNRSGCPLANSRYCTVLEQEGRCYLYIKTAERAHTPLHLWEIIELSEEFPVALKAIQDNLMYWPKFLVHKAQARLVKIRQYLIRMRNLKLKVRPKLVGIDKRRERRDAKRENKALQAARIDDAIKKELLERLHSGVYDDVTMNFPQEVFEEVLEENEIEDDIADEVFYSDYGDEDDEHNDDIHEEIPDSDVDDPIVFPRRKRPHVEIEYEVENVDTIASK